MVCGEHGGEARPELSDGISVAPPKLSLDCEDSPSNGATTLPGIRLPLF
jgi:hypothetical protein